MEMRDIYNIKRQKIGTKDREEQLSYGEYILAVHIWFINNEGKILIQKRSLNKKYDAGKWAVTGGHAISGEDSALTCLRETEEELGFTPDLQNSAIVISFIEQHFIFDVWIIKTDIELQKTNLQTEEVSEIKWVALDELKSMHFETGGTFKNGVSIECQKYNYMNLLYPCIEKLGSVSLH